MQDTSITKRFSFILFTLFICFAWLIYESGLLLVWVKDEEYGHGFMVIGLLGYIIYRNRGGFELNAIKSRWLGVVLAIISLCCFYLGEISGIAPIRMYSVWLFFVAATFSFGGWALFKKLVIPLSIIFLIIPLPNVLGPMLTSKLQLISSQIGVWLIRLFGGVVFLEGNIIDLGGAKLLVAEACSGLRYLFPLMSIGAIAAYIMKAPVWMRIILFISTIPITIMMNSIRIAITGMLSEIYGPQHTEGFLHLFEGWVVFVSSLFLIIILTYSMLRLTSDSRTLLAIFSLDDASLNSYDKKNTKCIHLDSVAYIYLSLLFIAVLATTPLLKSDKVNIVRQNLSNFPDKISIWEAKTSRLPVNMEVTSGASDYYHAYLYSKSGKRINLYIAYYEDQKYGVAPHSPELCIPGSGWKIVNNSLASLKTKNGVRFQVSRLLITKGDRTTIAYYWLKQGGRIFTKQFLARLDLLRFSVVENRADAGLIRITTEIEKGETISDGEERIRSFSSELLKILDQYVPD